MKYTTFCVGINWGCLTSLKKYIMKYKTRCNNNGLLIIPVSSTCFGELFCPSSGALDCVLQLVVQCTHDVAGRWPATSWVRYSIGCNTKCSDPEDGQNNCPKHVELTGIINKSLLLHLVGCLLFISMITVKEIWDNEIYLLIKYIKSVLWRVAKRLSYIEDARCLKVNAVDIVVAQQHTQNSLLLFHSNIGYANAPQGYFYMHRLYSWMLHEVVNN